MGVITRSSVVLILAALLAAGCGNTSTPAPSSAPSSSGGALSAGPSASPSADSSVAPVESPSAAASPTGGPVVLDGTWLSPRAGVTVATYPVTLAARVTASPSAVQVAKVTFSVSWPGVRKQACSAAVPRPDGAYRCSVNLVTLGAPLGKITFSFDVADTAGHIARSPAGSRAITWRVAPPAPTAFTAKTVTFTTTCTGITGPCNVSQLRWRARGPITSFRIYVAWLGEGSATCATAAKSATLTKTVSGGSRSTQLKYAQSTGRGAGCVWIAAVNAVGPSTRTLASGRIE